MRILALDYASVGAAAWTAQPRVQTRHFDFCQIAGVPKSKQAQSHDAIFKAAFDTVIDLIDEAQPDVIAVEKDTGRGYNTIVMFGGFRGMVLLAARERGIRVISDIDASTARYLAGVGGGSTKKEVAGTKARLFFGLPVTLSDDEVDAVVLHEAVKARLADERMQARLKPARKRRAA
ncbi:crossover junction endodeoxyribonuclease RuvC [Microvirga yunnanensis]|uniref:crossover junction endodeoxyribonuclease RuvC n=1 Tax=Microvirga yunnanensis TaxID=2953740 RepID=UPI0021C5EED4|nr:crossover junction endodeoxyribonuclease RuvC [Microvirga sp. HBU67655]